MIIEIEGYFHQALLKGEKCTKQKLKQMYLEVKELPIEITDLPNIFCRLHGFEQIPYDKDIVVEFVIDIDTDRIYTPSY
jgi:hypothetical protein